MSLWKLQLQVQALQRVQALQVQLLQELDKMSLEQKRPITIPLVRQLMNW